MLAQSSEIGYRLEFFDLGIVQAMRRIRSHTWNFGQKYKIPDFFRIFSERSLSHQDLFGIFVFISGCEITFNNI